MSGTEKRDRVVNGLANGKAFFYRSGDPKYRAQAEQQVDEAIAEALRNAAVRIGNLIDTTGDFREVPGLDRASQALLADAAALDAANKTEGTED